MSDQTNNVSTSPLIDSMQKCNESRMMAMKHAQGAAHGFPENAAAIEFTPPFLCASTIVGNHGVMLGNDEVLVVENTEATESANVTVYISSGPVVTFYLPAQVKRRMMSWMDDSRGWSCTEVRNKLVYSRLALVYVSIPAMQHEPATIAVATGMKIEIH